MDLEFKIKGQIETSYTQFGSVRSLILLATRHVLRHDLKICVHLLFFKNIK